MSDSSPLRPGATIRDRYQIERELSQGGFATVYLTRDIHLHGKPVVLKILDNPSSALVRGRAAMERELRSLALLNHPALVGALDWGTLDDGTCFLVMQYVEGQTLRQIAERGRLPVDRTIALINPIAKALAAAHHAGVCHLDLKPENIIVSDPDTENERITIIDFGIARLIQSTACEPWQIGGSRNYMPPEQRAGKPVAASDIYALGAIAWELLTGEAPVEPGAVIDRSPYIPAEVHRAIRRAMAADPAGRYQTSTDFIADLSRGIERSRRRRTLALRICLSAAAVLMIWLFVATSNRQQPLARPVPLTGNPGIEQAPAFSPDGKRVFFAWRREHTTASQIFVLNEGAVEPVQLTRGAAPGEHPHCSPDGKTLAFFRFVQPGLRNLVIMPSTGGTEKVVSRAEFHSMTWWDNRRIFASLVEANRARIVRIDVETGVMEDAFSAPADYRGDAWPAVSPDGSRLAFVRNPSRQTAELRVVDIREQLPLAANSIALVRPGLRIESPQWTPDGREIVFARGTLGAHELFRIRTDGASDPAPISEAGTSVSGPAIPRFAWMLAFSRDNEDSNIWEFTLGSPSGQVASRRKLIASTRVDEEGRYSPDGKQVAFMSRRSGPLALWIARADGSNPRRITDFAEVDDGIPFWYPGSSRLGFSLSLAGTGPAVFVYGPDGVEPQRSLSGLRFEAASSVSRDGKWVYFSSNRSGRFQMFKYSTDTGREVQVTERDAAYAIESCDGQTLFFCARHEGEGIWQMPAAGGEPTRLTGPLARRKMMAVSCNGIYYLARGAPPRLMFYRFADQRHVDLAPIEHTPAWGMDVSPDGSRLLIGLFDVYDSDIMIVRNFR